MSNSNGRASNLHQILFICTGNYYRSRFAEEYLNFNAEKFGLQVQAFSRGFGAAKARNKGPVSVFAQSYLQELQVPPPLDWPFPVQLQDADFDRADQVIVLDEKEHRPMMERDFSERLHTVTFWSFQDIQFEEPAVVLPAIRKQVDVLVDELLDAETKVSLEYQLNGFEYIPLNDLLKVLNLVGSGGEANARIVAGEVSVNDLPEIQKRKKLRPGDRVFFQGRKIVVR